MGYSIKVLSSDEFEALPYNRLSTSLGVADPKINTAYIRETGVHELNKYLIDHEFEHLIEEIPTDEFEGVRYKDMGSFFSSAGKMAQQAGPIVSMFNPGVGAAMTVGGGLVGGKGPTQGIAPGQSGYGQLNPMQLAQQNQKNSQLGFMSPVLDMFKSSQAQLGSSLLGIGLNKKNPKVPDLPQSVHDLKGQVKAGGSPLGQFAQQNLRTMMSQEFQPLSEPEIQAATRQLDLDQEKAEDQVRDLYRNLRPGTDPSSDSSFQRDLADVQNRFATMKADQLATRTRDVKGVFDSQRMQQIQQSLGASNEQMSQLAQLAQLDVQQIMTQLQMDYAEAQYFKQVFSNLGGNMILQGMNPNFGQFSSFNVS